MYAVEKYNKEKETTIEQWEFESLEDARIKFNNECLEFRKSSETNPKLSILCCEIDEKDEYEEIDNSTHPIYGLKTVDGSDEPIVVGKIYTFGQLWDGEADHFDILNGQGGGCIAMAYEIGIDKDMQPMWEEAVVSFSLVNKEDNKYYDFEIEDTEDCALVNDIEILVEDIY